jgi:condensation domain-containing protein
MQVDGGGREPRPAMHVLPASYTQRRIAAHVAGRRYADTISRAWRIMGRLDVESLQRALAGVARRHETLRTGLAIVDGAVVQRVDDRATLHADVVSAAGARNLARIARDASEATFDLASPPLARVVLARLSRDDHVLLVGAGHAIWDALSTRVFERDLFTLYAGGRIPALRTHYANCAAAAERPPDPRARAHWAARLAGASRHAPPPLSRNGRTADPEVAWARFDGPSASSARRLAAVARASRSTPGLTMLAAYAATVAAVCDTDRVTLGLLHANRDSAEWRELVGYCIDALLVPVVVSRGSTFRELVRDVTADVFLDYQWRVPIARQLELLGGPGGSAFHELVFNPLPETPAGACVAPGIRVAALQAPKRRYSRDAAWPRATLLMTVAPAGARGLALDVEFDPQIVPVPLVARLARAYAAFLGLAAARPDATLRRLEGLARRRAALDARPVTPGRRAWSG